MKKGYKKLTVFSLILSLVLPVTTFMLSETASANDVDMSHMTDENAHPFYKAKRVAEKAERQKQEQASKQKAAAFNAFKQQYALEHAFDSLMKASESGKLKSYLDQSTPLQYSKMLFRQLRSKY
jgi:hypothetical protein